MTTLKQLISIRWQHSVGIPLRDSFHCLQYPILVQETRDSTKDEVMIVQYNIPIVETCKQFEKKKRRIFNKV